MHRRRVVIDATPLLYRRTGIGRLTAMLIGALADLELPWELVLFGRRLLGRGLRQLGTGLRSRQLRMPRRAESLIRELRLVELLCRGDLYHATDFYLPMRPDRANVIATVHDVIFLAEPEKMIDHARLAGWAPNFARGCRRLIAPSEYSKRDIEAYLGFPADRIDVVYPGVERALFHPGRGRSHAREVLEARLGLRRPYFLAVSCSLGRKNTKMLLDAYATLRRNGPDNDLVLVWDPPPEIRSAYSEGDLAGRVHFVGRQSDQALAELYRGATALVFPSLYEGFGMPILEAMASGTPVVYSSSSSIPEVAGGVGLSIDPRDEATLVRALEICENEPDRLARFAERGMVHAAQFTWERCARDTAAAYARCLS